MKNKFSVSYTIFLYLIVFFHQANAAEQIAEMVCVQNGTILTKNKETTECNSYELHVTFSPGQDAGKQGAFGVMALATKTGKIGYWTEKKGWSPYTDMVLIKPTEDTLKAIDAKRDYIVFKGNHEELCRLANNQDFNLYAWHVVLQQDAIMRYKKFMQKFEITGWQAENYMNSILFRQALLQKKVKLVYSNTCI